MHIQSLLLSLETIRLQHGNLKVELSDGDNIAPLTSVATPTDENGERTVVLTALDMAHTIDALRSIVEATAAYHQYDIAGRPWLTKALAMLPDNALVNVRCAGTDHLAQANLEHPDTDEHRAGCVQCQYIHDSKLPD